MMGKDKMDSNAKNTDEVFEARKAFDEEDIIIPKPIEKEKKIGRNKKITITFRHNRTFELHLGQEVMRFEGRETKQIDKELLKHPAFIQARKYFNIKGI